MPALSAIHIRLISLLAVITSLLGLGTSQSTGTPLFLPLIQRSGTAAPVPAPTGERWSQPSTWASGQVPKAGDAVVIPAGKSVLLDVSPPQLKSIMILGNLVAAEQDFELKVGWMMIHAGGALRIGAPGRPFPAKASITFDASDPEESVMGMGTRGLLVMGGTLQLVGVAPAVPWTQLNDHANAGATKLTLKEQVDWKPGDQLIIAPTDFYDGNFIDTPQTERLPASAVAGTSVTLATPLARSRWGKLQYATDNGMSLTPGPIKLPATDGKTIPTTLDERAEVGNLTRNIVIQGADDALWQNQGFGAQVMIMDRSSSVTIDGVELRRMGQATRFGRYPIHFHNLSYDSNGIMLGDVPYVVRNSTVWNSSQRCMVIHGSNGITLSNNICYDIAGHGIFLEDAVERRNIIERNLVVKVRMPAKPLLKHEGSAEFGSSSGFWLVNPDNVVRGNVTADVAGHGFWLAYPLKPLGVNKLVDIRPSNTPFGVFEDNVAHSVGQHGIFLDGVPTSSDIGETIGNKYIPTVNGAPDTYDNRLRFTLARVTVYKNGSYWGGGGGIWNRNSAPDFLEWVSADHMGGWFAGAGDNGLIARSLMIGESLNNRIPRVNPQPIAALASYHSTFDITKNIILGFPFEEKDNQSSGAFRTDDYYIRAVDKGMIRNPDNRLINTHPGRRVKPFTAENWTIAGALWDPYGYWGPAQQYWVYDEPFFTDGAMCQKVAPVGTNGASCAGEYYGVGGFVTDFDPNRYSFKAPIQVIRQRTDGSPIGTWAVGDGNTAPKLGNMRHFAARTGGEYMLTFPGNLPRNVFLEVTNAYRANDSFVLGVAFDGTVSNAVIGFGTFPRPRESYSMSSSNANAKYRRVMVPKTSLEAVRASDDGYWHDKANNIFWFKVKGGLPSMLSAADMAQPFSDEVLYQPLSIEIFQP